MLGTVAEDLLIIALRLISERVVGVDQVEGRGREASRAYLVSVGCQRVCARRYV